MVGQRYWYLVGSGQGCGLTSYSENTGPYSPPRPHTHTCNDYPVYMLTVLRLRRFTLLTGVNSRTAELWNYVTPYGSHMTAEPLKYGISKLRCAVSEKYIPDFKGTVLKKERRISYYFYNDEILK